jgi:hypothetical protein
MSLLQQHKKLRSNYIQVSYFLYSVTIEVYALNCMLQTGLGSRQAEQWLQTRETNMINRTEPNGNSVYPLLQHTLKFGHTACLLLSYDFHN